MPTGVYVRVPKPLPDPMPRFWRWVDKTPTCWLWKGKRDKGYGKFWHNGRTVTAARFIYERTIGPIPPGQHVCHRCDTPACVRPDHLFVGTARDNVHDAIHKGRFDPMQVRRVQVHYTGEANGNHKLTAQDVQEIRQRYHPGHAGHASDVSFRGLARIFGVSKYAIQSIIHGKTWRHLPTSDFP